MDRDQQDLRRIAGRYLAVGIEMVVAVAIGTLGGQWLDNKLGTTPYLFWFGVAVGMGAAARPIVVIIKRALRDQL